MKLSLSPQQILLDRKLYCLEIIAERDVASALPPSPEIPQSREALLAELQEIERELDALGVKAEDRDVTLLAKGRWAAQDANQNLAS